MGEHGTGWDGHGGGMCVFVCFILFRRFGGLGVGRKRNIP